MLPGLPLPQRLVPVMLGFFTLLVLMAAAVQWPRGWHLETDLQALLPHDAAQQRANHAFETLNQAFGDRLLLGLQLPARDLLRPGADVLDQALARSELALRGLESDKTGQSASQEKLSGYRFGLLTKSQRQALGRGQLAGIARRAAARLFGLPSGARALSPAQDPLALFEDFTRQMQPNLPGSLLDDKWVLKEGDGTLLVYPLRLQDDSLSIAVHDRINALVADIQQQLNGGARLLRSGVAFHAAEASDRARQEVFVIGMGSLAGILLLFLFAFRRPRPLLLSVVSIAYGCVSAFVLSHYWFQQVHIITLVFGAGLLGVVVDYSLHFFCQQQDRQVPGRDLLVRILPALTLGLMTSLLGYACLYQADVAVLQQVASFSLTGLIGAWLFVVACYPRLAGASLPPAPGWLDRLAGVPEALREKFFRYRWGGGLAIVLLILTGLSWGQFSSDVRVFYSPSADLQYAEQTLGRHMASFSPSQFFIVRGESPEALLRAEQDFRHQHLDKLQADESIASYAAVSQLIPPRATQAANYALLSEGVYAPGGLAEEFMHKVGFAEGDITRLQTEFAQAKGQWLLPEEGVAWLPPHYQSLWLGPFQGEYLSVIALRGLKDSLLPAEAASRSDAVVWVDRVQQMSASLQRLSVNDTDLLVLSYLAVLVLLWLWYRKGTALKLVLLPLGATVLSLSLLALAGHALNLFHIFGCFLVLGLGMDYAIFMYQSGYQDVACRRAVLLSAATSCLSFGLLSFSSTPMISAFGITLLLGSLCNWFLLPLVKSPILGSGCPGGR